MGDKESSRIITATDVRRRYKDQVGQGYTDIANFVKGGVVVAAAIAILDLFKHFAGAELYERIFYLIATLLLSLVPLVTYRRGVLLGTVRLSLFDYIAPLAMGGAEVMMLLIVSQTDDHALWNDFRVAWLFAVMVHSWSATLLVLTRLRLSRFAHDFDQELHERGLYRRYISWMYLDLYGSFGFGVLAFLAWMGELPGIPIDTAPYVRPHGYALGALVLGLMALLVCFVTTQEHEQIRKDLGDD